jgi:TPR repeat protein
MKLLLLLGWLTILVGCAKLPHDIVNQAEAGSADEQFRLGHMYEFGLEAETNTYGIDFQKDEKEAFKWYLMAAEQGYARAQSKIATMFQTGKGVSKNDEKAFEWHLKAAQQGNSNAMYNLGQFYNDGLGVAIDYKEAFNWYEKSAQQGNASAQSYLGNSYYLGVGVPEDYVSSYVWFSMAVKSENKFAADAIKFFESELTKEQLAEGQARATKCFKSNFKDCD